MKALILAMTLTLAALPALIGACSENSGPVKLSVTGIALGEVSYRVIAVDAVFRMENRGESAAVMDRLEYDIYFGHKDKWIWLGQGRSQTATAIGPGETVDFTIETRVEGSPLIRRVTEAVLGAEPSQMKVEGRASFTMGESVFEMHFQRAVPTAYHSEGQALNPPAWKIRG